MQDTTNHTVTQQATAYCHQCGTITGAAQHPHSKVASSIALLWHHRRTVHGGAK